MTTSLKNIIGELLECKYTWNNYMIQLVWFFRRMIK